MKEAELRAASTCGICGQKVGASGLPLFWRVTVERYGIDMQACAAQQGLAMMLGGRGDLAQIMGPDRELAKPVMTPVTLTVCETCCTAETCVASLGGLR